MDKNTITDPAQFIRRRLSENTPRLAWRPGGDDTSRDAWQAELRDTVAQLLGGIQPERCPLNARVIETRDFDYYRRESVLFDTREGFTAFGYWLTPLPARQGPQPAVLCVAGHNHGVDGLVGIDVDGNEVPVGDEKYFQKNYALQCVKRGYSTFALEQISFGRRADPRSRVTAKGGYSCNSDARAALMLGETLAGWRVWDAMRAIDYMITRSEVDPDRIAIMGVSGGAMTTLYTACMDTRIALAFVSAYFCTFADSIAVIDHCICNHVPGMLATVEMPDLAGLIAPRKLFVESGTKDGLFPIDTCHRAMETAKKIFAAFHAPENFGSETFEGPHSFYGVRAFEFIRERL